MCRALFEIEVLVVTHRIRSSRLLFALDFPGFFLPLVARCKDVKEEDLLDHWQKSRCAVVHRSFLGVIELFGALSNFGWNFDSGGVLARLYNSQSGDSRYLERRQRSEAKQTSSPTRRFSKWKRLCR